MQSCNNWSSVTFRTTHKYLCVFQLYLIMWHVITSHHLFCPPLHRQPRLSLWWWWSSVSLGCLTTLSTCGWSLALFPSTKPPSCSGWWLTAWLTATPPSTPSFTPSCQRTSGTPTNRFSTAGRPATILWTTPGTSAAEWRQRHPPTSVWLTKVMTLRSVKCFDVTAERFICDVCRAQLKLDF